MRRPVPRRFGANRSGAAESDPAPQRAGPSGSDGDPGAGGAGGSADDVSQCRAGVDEVLRGTFAKLRHRPGSRGALQVAQRTLAKCIAPTLAEVESVSEHIQEYDEQIENIGKS